MKKKLYSLPIFGSKNALSLILAISITAVPFMLLYLYNPTFFNVITQDTNHHLAAFRLFRWGLILLFIVSWSSIIRKLGNFYAVSNEQIIQWQAEILKVIVWMVLFEIVVCENVITKIIHYW